MVVTLEENKENENVPGPSGLQRSKIVIQERGDEKKKFHYQESNKEKKL